MAPIKTYTRGNSLAPKSTSALNNLNPKTLPESTKSKATRRKKKPLPLKELPARGAHEAVLSDDSSLLVVRKNDTFDQLLASSNSLPKIRVQTTVHSPVISSNEISSTGSYKRVRTLDRSVNVSLEIENDLPKQPSIYSLNLTYDSSLESRKRRSLPHLLIAPGTKTLICSTPIVPICRNRLVNESQLSPISRDLQRTNISHLKESLQQIEEWSRTAWFSMEGQLNSKISERGIKRLPKTRQSGNMGQLHSSTNISINRELMRLPKLNENVLRSTSLIISDENCQDFLNKCQQMYMKLSASHIDTSLRDFENFAKTTDVSMAFSNVHVVETVSECASMKDDGLSLPPTPKRHVLPNINEEICREKKITYKNTKKVTNNRKPAIVVDKCARTLRSHNRLKSQEPNLHKSLRKKSNNTILTRKGAKAGLSHNNCSESSTDCNDEITNTEVKQPPKSSRVLRSHETNSSIATDESYCGRILRSRFCTLNLAKSSCKHAELTRNDCSESLISDDPNANTQRTKSSKDSQSFDTNSLNLTDESHCDRISRSRSTLNSTNDTKAEGKDTEAEFTRNNCSDSLIDLIGEDTNTDIKQTEKRPKSFNTNSSNSTDESHCERIPRSRSTLNSTNCSGKDTEAELSCNNCSESLIDLFGKDANTKVKQTQKSSKVLESFDTNSSISTDESHCDRVLRSRSCTLNSTNCNTKDTKAELTGNNCSESLIDLTGEDTNTNVDHTTKSLYITQSFNTNPSISTDESSGDGILRSCTLNSTCSSNPSSENIDLSREIVAQADIVSCIKEESDLKAVRTPTHPNVTKRRRVPRKLHSLIDELSVNTSHSITNNVCTSNCDLVTDIENEQTDNNIESSSPKLNKDCIVTNVIEDRTEIGDSYVTCSINLVNSEKRVPCELNQSNVTPLCATTNHADDTHTPGGAGPLLSKDCASTLPLCASGIEDPDLVEDSFAMPTMPISKPYTLKPGKDWRRSFYNHKRDSILLKAATPAPVRCNKDDSCCCQSCKKPRPLSVCRQSIAVAAEPSARRNSVRKSLIDVFLNHSRNPGYAPDNVVNPLGKLFEGLSVSLNDSLLPLQQQQAEDLFTARDIVLRRCDQTKPLPFSECYPPGLLKNCHKIGEGVYGEVFLFRNKAGGTSVMKVIPIEGALMVNGERQKKFDEILTEIVIALELSDLRKNKKNFTNGFSEVCNINCVQGKYPDRLLDLWDLYDDDKASENDRPDVFGNDQLYIVLELSNGGKDLESFVFNNAQQSFSIFRQAACSLAVAESALQFEHRDLHWGNVLISTVDKAATTKYNLNGREIVVPSNGVQLSIIDFTLSRITCDGVCTFNDLGNDPELFNADGDYQFEIYRLMQKCNKNDWQVYEPYTNILWLHYTVDKMITAVRYKNPLSKIHKTNIEKLQKIKDEILKYRSVETFVTQTLLE